MEKSKVEITVKGQTYTIITDDAPEKVLALANGLNTTLDNIMSSGKVTLIALSLFWLVTVRSTG